MEDHASFLQQTQKYDRRRRLKTADDQPNLTILDTCTELPCAPKKLQQESIMTHAQKTCIRLLSMCHPYNTQH